MPISQQAQVMIVAPHTDDAEFSIAGTVAKWAREGKSIVYVICTNGDKGSRDPDVNQEELARTREEEQRNAAKMCGVREVVFLGYPDQGLEDTTEYRKKIVRWIRTFRPDTILTADPYRKYIWHRDHRICGQVTLDAIFPFARDPLSYPELMKEGLMPHKVKELFLMASEDPNYHVDITPVFDLKLAALRCHKSQMEKNIPFDLEEVVRKRARLMAEGQNYELAESFHRVDIPY